MLQVLLFMAHEALAFYNPETGRWLSRDPIGEKGGLNLSSFCGNDAPGKYDPLGLDYYIIKVKGACGVHH